MSLAFNGGILSAPVERAFASLFVTRWRPAGQSGRAPPGTLTVCHDGFCSGLSATSAAGQAARLTKSLDRRLDARLWTYADSLSDDKNQQMVAVTSLQNSKVKLMRSLHQRRTRDEQFKVLVEGHRLVCDVIEGGYSPDFVFVSPKALAAPTGDRLQAALGTLSADVVAIATPEVVQRCCDTVTSQGVVAVVDRPVIPLPTTLPTVLICDGIRDPGNLGTLVRTAAGLGTDGVVLTGACVDYWAPKTLRSSMGAAFRLPSLQLGTWEEVVDLMYTRGVRMYAAETGAKLSYCDADWTGPSALVVGAEARGLGDGARRGLENGGVTGVSVPLVGGVESLNAAVAGAVILGEAQRQRTVAKRPK